MGPTCSRRKSAEQQQQQHLQQQQQHHPGEGGGSTNDNWCLIELPKDVLVETPRHQLQGSPRAPTHIACPKIAKNRGRWIKAVLKIRLLRQFRIRWSRTGAWLNLHPRGAGTAPPEQRAVASRLWAADGRAILQRYATGQLFAAVVPIARLTKSDLQELARFREVSASLRAELDSK